MALAAIIAGIAMTAWWVIGLYWIHSREVEEELPKVGFVQGIQEVLTGAPLALMIFFAFMFLSMVGYVLYIWQGGISY